MSKSRLETHRDSMALPARPGWMAAAGAGGVEDAAFLAGAALAHLHLVAGQPAVPQALWRARLALAAAEACAGLLGRREGAGALRDALYLLRAGDQPGPAGAILRQWSRAVERPISVAGLGAAIEAVGPETIGLALDATGGNPVDRAAAVIEAVLADTPRAETAALILADAVLAKALGWDHVVPLLALALKARDLRLRDDALRLACYRAVGVAAGQAAPLAADLALRAARLRAVVPKLRAKGAGRAVDLFLSRDALAPGALVGVMSDRAARRFCDRLVDLGVLREVTGRDVFRLYGL